MKELRHICQGDATHQSSSDNEIMYYYSCRYVCVTYFTFDCIPHVFPYSCACFAPPSPPSSSDFKFLEVCGFQSKELVMISHYLVYVLLFVYPMYLFSESIFMKGMFIKPARVTVCKQPSECKSVAGNSSLT